LNAEEDGDGSADGVVMLRCICIIPGGERRHWIRDLVPDRCRVGDEVVIWRQMRRDWGRLA